MKAVCYDCPDRKVGCHSTCEAYKKFAEQREQINHARFVEHELLYGERNRKNEQR